jgi:DNA-directed RNA polymerase subunit RPC12/RpoP
MGRQPHDSVGGKAHVSDMAVHAIELRWPGRCSRCRTTLEAGELARFDDETRLIACPDCRSHRRPATDRARVTSMIAGAREALEEARRAS